MNTIKSLCLGYIFSYFPILISLVYNFNYRKNKHKEYISEICNLIFFITFYVLNYRKNKWQKINYNDK